jgi:hypothetical protein
MLCIVEGTPMESHLNEFNLIIMDLLFIGIEIDNEDHVLLFLYYLSSIYHNFRKTFLFSRKTITLEEVYSSLVFKYLIERHFNGH